MYPTNSLLISNQIGDIRAGVPRNYGFPKGSIILWNQSTIPSGWAECDGEQGRPDFRGRFPIGVGSSVGNYSRIPFFSLGEKGGAETHTLTTDELPSHTHTGTTDPAGWGAVDKCGSWGAYEYTLNSGTHSHSFTTDATGGGQAHNNMPPYYVLKFIIKL